MSKHKPAANGFSLVEVVVAIVVLTVGMLALGTVSGFVTAQIHATDLRTERMIVTQQVTERLRATPWAQLVDGSATVGRYEVSWDVQAVHQALNHIVIVTVGPGYRGGRVAGNLSETLQISVIRP